MFNNLFKKNNKEKQSKSRPASNGTRVLSSILISFVIFTNLFAPFSVGFDKKGVEISKNEASASWILDGTDTDPIRITTNYKANDTTIVVSINVAWPNKDLLSKESVYVMLLSAKQDDPKKTTYDQYKKVSLSSNADGTQSGSVEFSGLTPLTTYKFDVRGTQNDTTLVQSFLNTVNTIFYTIIPISSSSEYLVKNTGEVQNTTPYEITTLEKNNTTFVNQQEQEMQNGASMDSNMPACSLAPSTWYSGCVGRLLYYAVFVPTSYLFALSGIFFDSTFAYSVQDISYRSAFVVEGWGLVRDFCNLFFIFVLLYVAISTILDIHGFKTKDTIIHVVVIGLLINFSLFATQVIIDASNVTTRVFYNADTIKISQGSNTGASDWVAKADENGVLPMSAALVNKINPQNIVLHYQKINDIQVKGGENVTGQKENNGIGAGAFIVIVLMASAVNIIGFIVFLSIGLIFVSRVVGLWVAMIMAPLAFFTYIIPSFAKTKMIGWENWWPDTLKLAFLAPVFMFFMYLILKFLELDIISDSTKDQGGLYFFISILIPFAFIIVLLLKAKSIASDMSGEMGKQITGGVTAAGGMLLGGAALGTAFLGRKTIGSVAKNIQNDGARNKDLKTFGGYKDWSLTKKLNPFAYIGQAGKTATAGVAAGIHATGLGKKMKDADEKFGHKTHASHLLDAKMQSEFGHQYGKDAKYKDLTEHEQSIVKAEIDKDELAKFQFGKLFKDLEAPQAKEIKDMYDGRNPTTGALGGPEMRAISDEHGKTLRLESKTAPLGPGEKIKSDYITATAKTNAAFGEFTQALRKGSYDFRNLSQSKFSSKGVAKMGVGLAALVASGVRMGLKKGVGIEHGTGQKDFMKDLGNTVTEALKGIKIDVKSSGGGHEDSGHKEVKSVGH